MMVTFHNFKRIHMVGIGGIGMSGIAEVLLTLGYNVSGSDSKLSAITDRLTNLGATVYEGHRAENVSGAHVIVTSSAVRKENPEVVEAHRLKIPVIPRAEMLAELMRLKYGIAVAGAHGKTTTTSMVASVLAAADLDPTFVVGGRVNQAGTTARLGKGEYMVVEADESDRTFLLLAPVVAVVTSIDREHLDHYDSLDDIQDAFTKFVNRVPFYGAAILCMDEPNVQAILPSITRPIISYGTSSQADLVISDIVHTGLQSDFRLTYRGDDLGMFHLNGPPGMHNIRNAAAAAAVALYLDVPADLIREGLGGFHRSWPPLRRQGRHQRHHSYRRLRPSSVRNPRHAGSRAPLQIQPRAGAVSTASIHPHAAHVGRILPHIQQCRRAGDDRHLRRQRNSDSGHFVGGSDGGNSRGRTQARRLSKFHAGRH